MRIWYIIHLRSRRSTRVETVVTRICHIWLHLISTAKLDPVFINRFLPDFSIRLTLDLLLDAFLRFVRSFSLPARHARVLGDIKDLILFALLFIIVLQRLSQDSLLLLSVKKDGAFHQVHVDELLLEALRLVLAQLDVLVVDLLKLDQGEVRPGNLGCG